MPEATVLDWFSGLFKGNTSFYVKHQGPFVEAEGKLKAKWCGFATYNRHNPPPEGRETGDFMPVTQELYQNHLNGGDGLAIAPLTDAAGDRNVCFYAAIDIDVYGISFTWLVRRLYDAGFKFAAFTSKSGGLHIYFFFKEPESADKVIAALEKIVGVFGLKLLYTSDKDKGKVEIFPKQATYVPGSTKVNCLFLPFYNIANPAGCRSKMLTQDGKLLHITRAIPVINGMFTSVKEINGTIKNLPYGDAPYCVQMVLLTGALAENDGRNNFLFSAAIYLKKKLGAKFSRDKLDRMNDCLESPLEDAGVNSVYKSVTEKNYDNYMCKHPPCSDYCDRQLCKEREYGVGRDKGNVSTGADCWGELYLYKAAEQYFEWSVRVDPDGPFIPLKVDSVSDLRNQAKMQELCWTHAHWAPMRVKENLWVATVNEAMAGIEDRTVVVSRASDTSELSDLRRHFINYLAFQQIQSNAPSMVPLGRVYRQDEAFYFAVSGLKAYLSTQKYNTGKINLRESLLSYGCEEATLSYTNTRGEQRNVECLKKSADNEIDSAGIYYEDAYDSEMDILQHNELRKDEEKPEEADGSDTRF
jgi:hypothetical protein